MDPNDDALSLLLASMDPSQLDIVTNFEFSATATSKSEEDCDTIDRAPSCHTTR